MVLLDIEKNNQNTQILINIPTSGETKMIKGFITDMLNINAQSSYTSPLESQAQQNLSNTLAALQGLITSTGAANQSLIPHFGRSLQQSVNVWTGSEKPVFDLRLAFVALRPGDDVMEMILDLYSAVYPTTESAFKADLLNPPLGYIPRPDAKIAENTISIRVGRWFKAHGLNMRNVNFTPSKEVTENGSPLYAEGNITVEPFRMITYEEFRAYFGK